MLRGFTGGATVPGGTVGTINEDTRAGGVGAGKAAAAAAGGEQPGVVALALEQALDYGRGGQGAVHSERMSRTSRRYSVPLVTSVTCTSWRT